MSLKPLARIHLLLTINQNVTLEQQNGSQTAGADSFTPDDVFVEAGKTVMFGLKPLARIHLLLTPQCERADASVPSLKPLARIHLLLTTAAAAPQSSTGGV